MSKKKIYAKLETTQGTFVIEESPMARSIVCVFVVDGDEKHYVTDMKKTDLYRLIGQLEYSL